MRKSRLFYFFTLLLLTACQKPQPAVLDLEDSLPTDISTLTEKDIHARLGMLSREDYNFAQTLIGRQNLIQVILREKLILADALAQNIQQSADYKKSAQEKKQQLSDIYREYTRQLLVDLWYQKQRSTGALDISNEEIAAYYKKYPYEMTVQQIIVDNAQTADQVLRTLKHSPGRWKEMSRQYNTAPDVIRDNNFTFMPGEFLPEIEVIAANSTVGSVQGFIKTALGFHIIKKTGEKHLSKEEATPRIRAVLENERLDAILESLQTKYEVMIYDKNE